MYAFPDWFTPGAGSVPRRFPPRLQFYSVKCKRDPIGAQRFRDVPGASSRMMVPPLGRLSSICFRRNEISLTQETYSKGDNVDRPVDISTTGMRLVIL